MRYRPDIAIASSAGVSARRVEGGEDFGGQQLGGRADRVAVGAEAGAGDDEAVDAEGGEFVQAIDDPVGRAGDREPVDELAR